MSTLRSLLQNFKLAASFGSAAAFVVILVGLLISWRDGLALLVAVLGAVLGWAAGVLLAPYKPEETRFKAICKGIVGFLTGYVVGKIDGVFDLLVDRSGGQPILMSPRFVRNLLMGLVCFLVATLWVFVARTYGERL